MLYATDNGDGWSVSIPVHLWSLVVRADIHWLWDVIISMVDGCRWFNFVRHIGRLFCTIVRWGLKFHQKRRTVCNAYKKETNDRNVKHCTHIKIKDQNSWYDSAIVMNEKDDCNDSKQRQLGESHAKHGWWLALLCANHGVHGFGILRRQSWNSNLLLLI